MFVGLRPDDRAYDASSGLVFHPQDESGNGNIPFYEVTATSDELDFDLRQDISGFDNPVLILNSIFGPTDFDLIDRNTSNAIVSEQSGFDSDVWAIDLSASSGRLRLTNFDTGNGVDGTQAGWQAIAQVLPLQV